MKRNRSRRFSALMIALGLLSGYWVSQTYGTPDARRHNTSDTARATSQLVREAASDVSAGNMPFLDFRKGRSL